MSFPFNNPQFPSNLPYDKQSYEVPGSKKPGQTAHYRNAVWPDLLQPRNPACPASTTYEAFQTGLQKSADNICLGHRPLVSSSPLKYADKYVWQTYAQVDERRHHLGSAIEGLFRSGKAGGGEYPTVGIWCINRPEWQIIDQAVASYSRVTVSLYDTLGPDVVEFILNHAEISITFVTKVHLPGLLAVAPKCSHLRVVVCIDDLDDSTRRVASAWATQYNLELFTLAELEATGKANPYPESPPKPVDLASICYTSGTTNVPKGALLSHWNLTSGAMAFTYGGKFESGAMLSYLPLAHIYERVNELTAFLVGGGVGYFTGDPLRLIEDAQVLKPKFFPSVPRVLNRVAMGISAAAATPGVKGALLRKALEVKLRNFKETGAVLHPFWDKVVFRKVKGMLGGQVIEMTTGSAPISGETLAILRVALCAEITEGWGMTETCAAGTRIFPGDPTAGGSVGFAHACNEIKLVDVPSMNYTVNDKPFPRGELCSRGPCVFKGYYKDPKNTKEALDSEGWLHTGDIAALDNQGRVRIIDRLKNIMKLSQGEYVALEKIENTYSTCPVVQQLYVHGDSLQDHLIGVLVPDFPFLAEIVSRTMHKRVKPEDVKGLQEAATDPKVRAAIQAALNTQAKKSGLRGFEHVKRVYVTFEPFTPDNNMLTPTLKLRRRDIYAKYKPVLDGMYSTGSTPTKL